VALSWAAAARTAPGDLDGSFSGDGWVPTLEAPGLETETQADHGRTFSVVVCPESC
jgi:hypothetical protein